MLSNRAKMFPNVKQFELIVSTDNIVLLGQVSSFSEHIGHLIVIIGLVSQENILKGV